VILLGGVEVGVRDRDAAAAFYDTFLTVLGAVRHDGERETTWTLPPPEAPPQWRAHQWFAIVANPQMTAGSTRVAFLAPSRGTVDAIATYLPAIGAQQIAMPHTTQVGGYACRFDDLDGNRVEVICLD
jgi:catechol 2,3-dioxygenase-like lactoylglutathione lyase family enzyme